MSTHPYIPLYVDDYDAATAHLTVEEDGVYSRLIRLCWRTPGCSLPNEPAWIARKIRVSADDFDRIVKPVLEEFFKVQRGRLVQKRLKAEYDSITRKKTARVNAGKKGGAAKALKTGASEAGNARDLPADTRAFPEPEPEPKKQEPPNPQGGEAFNPKPFAKALEIAADAGCAFPALVDRIHKAQPVCEGRRKATTPDVKRALSGALKRGGMPSAIWAAVQNFYALPASTKDGGQYANGAAVVLNSDRWKEYAAPAAADSAPAPSTFNAPKVRASIVHATDEDFARRWVDHYCRWEPEARRLEARTPAVAAALSKSLAGWAERNSVTIAVASANDGAALKQTGEAA